MRFEILLYILGGARSTEALLVSDAHPLKGQRRAMAYFLGIDGGGTKTTCMLGDEGSVLAAEIVGGSNIIRLGEEQARAAIGEGVRRVCARTGIKPGEIVAVCAGVSGAAQPSTRQQIAQILADVISGEVEVVGDMVVAHEAALRGDSGIVVIAGTGSIAYARNGGDSARAGGWGHAISDEGSGHWIGKQAVIGIMRALDAGRQTSLSQRILASWMLESFDELVRYANASPPPDFSALFPVVLEEADGGDGYASDILNQAGSELAGLAELVFRRLWNPDDPVKIALTGGVVQNSQRVCDSFEREARSAMRKVEVFRSSVAPAEGALRLARTRWQVAANEVT